VDRVVGTVAAGSQAVERVAAVRAVDGAAAETADRWENSQQHLH
jgi:hypothetical protein